MGDANDAEQLGVCVGKYPSVETLEHVNVVEKGGRRNP